MIAQLAGFTLSRAIPDKALLGVLTGAYKIYGGVIRNDSGKIVAHLVNGFNPLSFASPVGTILSGINTFQLHRIGKDVVQLKESVAALQAATAQLMTLAKGTMLLSGLTLAVSAAGFVFLARKLSKIDEKLERLGKDVKVIRQFLELNERARLTAALKTLGGLDETVDDKTRIPLLVNARQTLGEINEKYRELFVNVDSIQEVLAIEEYYSVTAIGHAMCTAELDMCIQADKDFKESYQTWITTSQRVAREMVLKSSPERFLHRRYSKSVKTEEIIDWLDFTSGTDRQIEWIDDLRAKNSNGFVFSNTPSKQDEHEIDLLRKITARNQIFLGYASQLSYFSENNIRPSLAQKYIDSLSEDQKIDDCYLLVANAVTSKQQLEID